jgi:YegS/Rv2252/BmrU family lipid kinase
MKKALVVINPHAGRQGSRLQAFSITDALTHMGMLVTLYPTQKAGDAQTIVESIGAQYDLILCSGGDGTFSEVVSGLMTCDPKPPLAYLPAGTTNDFATSLHLPKQTKGIIDLIAHSDAYSLDVGQFNDVRYFTYSASFGLMTEVSYMTAQDQKNAWGSMAYLLEAVRRIPQIRSYPLELKTEGHTISGVFSLGMISNSTRVAGLIHFNPNEVSFDDGLFEILLVRDPESQSALARIILEVINGVYDPKYVELFQCKSASIHFDNPVAWGLDGEKGGEHQNVTLQNVQKAYRLYVPAQDVAQPENQAKE